LNLFFIGNFLYFFFAVFVAFYIPGSLALRKINVPFFHRIVLGIGTGMVLWALQGFLFGLAHARFLTYVYIILACLWWMRTRWGQTKIQFHPLKIEKLDLLIGFILLSGVLIQLTSVWFVGTVTPKGLYFCCANTNDNLYHLALTNQLIQHMPPQEPGMTGVIVHNYHYLGNIVVAELVRIFHLPLIQTQFLYTNFLISVLFGMSALVFAQVVGMKKQFQAWVLFFLYYGADLIYLLVSILRREINFSMTSLEDGGAFLNNPPRAFSIVLFFIGLALFGIWVTKKEKRAGWITAIVFGSLIGFKVYTGFFVLAGLSIVGVYFLWQRKYREMIPIILTGIISLLIYLPVNAGAGGFYYTGFNIFENFIVQPWMNLVRLEEARLIYEAHHNIPRLIEYETIYMVLYFFSVFGTKMLGLFQTKKSLQLLPKEINIFLIAGIAASLPLGVFFQQTSGGANSFNFLVSIFIIGSIYTALACYFWLNKIKGLGKYVCIAAIVLITIPRIINNTYANIHAVITHNGFLIDTYQLDAFNFLKYHTAESSVIAVNPKNFITDYEDAPYISFMTNRPEYLAGVGIITSHGVNVDTRAKALATIFSTQSCTDLQKRIGKSGIHYFIMSAPTVFGCKKTDGFLRIVYTNLKVKIYQYTAPTIQR
jgi:hypothetical protein